MYHMIVKKIVTNSFRQLSQGNFHAATELMHEQCCYNFIGQHALGGQKQNKVNITKWFERFLRLLPDFQFVPNKIIVSGWPWNTTIVVQLNVSWKKPDGTFYKNVAIQITTLKWFKAVEILTVDDTKAFGELLDELADKYGLVEAKAKPIED